MKLTTGTIKDKAASMTLRLRRYTIVLFVVFLLAIYGFLAFRIVALNQVEPDALTVQTKLQTAGVPKIDQDALNKIQQLQDNSVEVQALFDDARSNPFQE